MGKWQSIGKAVKGFFKRGAAREGESASRFAETMRTRPKVQSGYTAWERSTRPRATSCPTFNADVERKVSQRYYRDVRAGRTEAGPAGRKAAAERRAAQGSHASNHPNSGQNSHVAAEGGKSKTKGNTAQTNAPKDQSKPKEHYWRNHGMHAAKEFVMKHPWQLAGLVGAGVVYHNAQQDGTGVLKQLQALIFGGERDENGHLLSANGFMPTANEILSGTNQMDMGAAGSAEYNLLGAEGSRKVNLVLDGAVNEGTYLVGKGNQLIDSTGNVVGRVVNGSMDLAGKVVDGTGNILGQINGDGTVTYDQGAEAINPNGSYQGMSMQPQTRSQQLSQAMGPAELAGGIMMAMLGKGWLFKAIGGLTAFNGYQNIKQHNPQQQIVNQQSVNQGYAQQQSVPTVSYDTNEVVVNSGRSV